MTFEIKEITDEDRRKYKATLPERMSPHSKWVIDRERESYLISHTRDADSGIRVFYLFWKKQLLKVFLYRKGTEAKGETGNTIHNPDYIVDTFFMPSSLESEFSQLKNILEEALITYGWNCSQEYTGVTTVANMNDVKIQFEENVKIV